jgi:hypothetical protein
LTTSHHLAHRLSGTLVRAGRGPAFALILATGLAGCGHKTVRFVIPQGAQVPIELVAIPDPEPPAEIATLPEPELSPLSGPEPPKPPPRRRPPATKEETPPVQVADATSVAVAIGELSTGDEAMPQVHQQTQDMIVSIRKRIAALTPKMANSQKKQLSQVSRFLDQSQEALNSGDAEAAQNLAIKAKLLMDDIEKK